MTLASFPPPLSLLDPALAAYLLRLACAVTATWLAATLAALLLRRASAALRHRLWSLATLATLLLPALIATLPEHRVGPITLAPATPPLAPSIPEPAPLTLAPRAPVQFESTDRPITATPVARPTPARTVEITTPTPTPTPPNSLTPTPPPTPRPPLSPSPRLPLLFLFLLPTLYLLARLLLSHLRTHALLRRSTPVDPAPLTTLRTRFHLAHAPRLLESPGITSPLCLGLLRPTLLLPAAARTWPPDQLEDVLTHELAHVARRDVLWQTLARLACALYWFHPLAWLAAWRMRIERELACDDWVLRAGQSPTTYARHLLDVATALTTAPRAHPAHLTAVAMASPTNFEHRIRAILDPARHRLPVTRRTAALLIVTALALATLLGTLSPLAPRKATAAADAAPAKKDVAPKPDEKRVHISGRVEDEQGRPVPNALVEAVSLPSRPSTRTAADGAYTLEWPEARIFVRLRATSPDGTLLAIVTPPPPRGVLSSAPKDNSDPDDFKIVLKPTREFPVTVNDAAGQAVPDARVVVAAGYALAGEALTDSTGHARVRAPADAAPEFILAFKDRVGLDYHLFWHKDQPHNDPYRLEPDFAGPLTFILNGAKPVTVHVVDDKDRPLKGAHVYPWLLSKPKKGDHANVPGVPYFNQFTDDNGDAHFDYLPPDLTTPVNFWARLENYCAPNRFMWDPKTAPPTLEAKLLPMLEVTGHVLDPDGKPAPGATVKAAGAGYAFDDFRGQTKADPDGTFHIAVNPNMYYMFAAQQDGPELDKPRLISTPHLGIILDKAPAQPIELKLGPATRVFGRATAGLDKRPIPKAHIVAQHRDESYFKLPKEDRLPNPTDNRRAIMPMLPVWRDAADDGAYEFFLAPGEYDLYRSGAPSSGRREPLTIKPGQTEVEYNLHSPDARPTAKPNILTGRVVRADNPAVRIPEATLEGHHAKLDPIFIQGVSGKDGAFALRRGESDLYLFAATADKKLAGIALVKSTADTTTVPVGPTASATARLLDHDGRPAAAREIQFGTRIGPPNGPFNDAFGGTTTSADDGSFTVTGLVPGYEYHLNAVVERDADGRARAWTSAGVAKPDRPEHLQLGDRKLPKPYKPPTIDDYVTQAFGKSEPLAQRLDNARHTAQACFQNVLVVCAAPDRAPLRRFFDRWRDDNDDQVWEALANYVTVFVDVDTADAATRAWADSNKIPWPADKDAMTFVVLDDAGKLLTQLPAAPLFAGADPKTQRTRLIEFAKESARTLPDAQQLLDDALARAKREDKRVLLDQTGALCGWCVKLADYLHAQQALIDKDYVTLVLDRRMPHAAEILDRLRTNPENKYSTPWMAILDPAGKTLATSDANTTNIGYPGGPEGLAHWEQMLRSTAKRLTPGDIQTLLQPLREPPTPSAAQQTAPDAPRETPNPATPLSRERSERAPSSPTPKPGAAAQPPIDAPETPALKLLHLDVLDTATNRPLPAVKLSASVNRQQRVWSTDDTGHAPLDLPGDLKTITVLAEKAGYVPLKVSWSPARTKEPIPNEYLLKLEPGNTIGGRILDESGKPVPNVDIDLHLHRKGDPEVTNGYDAGEEVYLFNVKSRTDAQGRWSYPCAPRELVRPSFRFTHPDFLVDEDFVRAPADTASPEKLLNQTAVLTITKGVRIAGRVLDDHGNPVPAAQVSLGKTQYAQKPPPSTTTDVDGRFDLPHCKPGQRADLLVTAPGRAPTLTQFQLDKDTTNLEIRTAPARPLALRVTDPKGTPLPGVKVSAKLWRNTELLDFSAKTDPDGRLTWPDAPADPVSFSFELRGFMQQDERTFTANPDEQTVILNPALKIRGTVVDDETNHPIENFRVVRGHLGTDRPTPYWLRQERDVKPQPGGKFEYTETEEQPGYATGIEALGYQPTQSRILKPGEPTASLEFRLKKGEDLAATFLAPDGKPLAGATVLISTGAGQIFIENGAVDTIMTQCRLQSQTDSAGRLRLPTMLGDHMILVVHPAAYLELTPQQLAGNPTITAPAYAHIEGTARIGATPAAGATVEAYFGKAGPGHTTESTIRHATTVVDANGHYVLDHLYHGEVHVGIRPKTPGPRPSQMSGPSLRREVHLDPGQTLHLDLGGTGRPVTAHLIPPPAAAQKLDWYYAYATLEPKDKTTNNHHFFTPIPRDANLRFDDVPPGDYDLTVTLNVPPRSPQYFAKDTLATLKLQVTVPETPTRDPLDLGNLDLQQPH